MAKLFYAFALLASAAAQTVEGIALNSATGIGIPGIRVEIAHGKTVNATTTDPQGRFQFEDLQEGAWILRYSSADYARRAADLLQVTAGMSTKVEVRLTPFSRIAGRVVDGKGAPVPNARIQLQAQGSDAGGFADEEGKFEVHRPLPPGDYTLSATPSSGFQPPDPEPDSGRILAWGRTYYPGTPIRQAASKIHVAPGVEALNLEVKLLAVPAYAVRGVCLNPDGSPAPKVRVTLREGPLPRQTAETNTDGSFEFPAVVDAEWTLSAQLDALQATEQIVIAGRDMEGVKLHLNPPFTLSGKVLMEVPQGMPAPKLPPVYFRSQRGANFTARTQPDGSFTLDKLYPGSYSIDPLRAYSMEAGSLEPHYLDSIRVGGVEATTSEMELSGPTSLLLVYKTNGGAVRGTVDGCHAGTVWLVPQDPAMRSGFFRFADCLGNGHYELAAVRPGDYYAVANAGSGVPRPWLSGDFDQTLLNQSTKVTVRPGETTSTDLRAR